MVIGKSLIIIGMVILIVGLLVSYGPRIPYLGKLPGDIYYRKDDFVFYFPLGTSIVISLVLSMVIYLISRR